MKMDRVRGWNVYYKVGREGPWQERKNRREGASLRRILKAKHRILYFIPEAKGGP